MLKDIEVRIGDDGGMLVWRPLLMNGYCNQWELSEEVPRDGWLRTRGGDARAGDWRLGRGASSPVLR